MKTYTRFLQAVIALCCLLSFSQLQAQDPIFSQFFAQKVYLNPALSGYEPGAVLSTATRKQWGSLASNPLTPSSASYITNHVELSQDLPGFRSGFGIALTDNSEGEGKYNLIGANSGLLRWQRATFSYAFHSWDCGSYQSPGSEIFSFAIGGSASYNRFVLDWQNLVFGDQLDPIYGLVRSSAVQLPVDGISSIEDWDFSMGTVLQWNIYPKYLTRLGVAAHHISLPNNSVSGNDERLPMRFTVHGSSIIQIGHSRSPNERAQLIPNARVELQRTSAAWDRDLANGEKGRFHRDLSAGLLFKSPATEHTRLSAGIWYNGNFRWGDSPVAPNFIMQDHTAVFYGGVEILALNAMGNVISSWEVGLSYDWNLGGIRSVGNIYEISLSMGLPSVSLPGASCSGCKPHRILNRF